MTNHELKELVVKEIKEKYGETRIIPLNKSLELYELVTSILDRNNWYTGEPIKASYFINIINDIAIQSGGEGDEQFNVYLDRFEELFRPETLPIVYVGFECPAHIKRVLLEEKELQIKYDKLDKFLNSDKPKDISPKELDYMENQRAYMYQYLQSLHGRIEIYKKKAAEPIENFDKEKFKSGLEDIKELLYKNIGDVKNSINNTKNLDNYTVKMDNTIKLLSINTTQYLIALDRAINNLTD
jgi:hypothetical protein|nr:MAG TPA: hypothetical protein [Caudoviricetes sp.]